MSANLLGTVFANGGRAARYGEFTVVMMHGGSFITTPMEFTQVQSWARARTSSGNAVRDRSTFVDRFSVLLGRLGSGIGSRGSKLALQRIVRAMQASAVPLEDWIIPANLNESVEIARRKPREPVLGQVPAAAAQPANEPAAGGSIPPVVQ